MSSIGPPDVVILSGSLCAESCCVGSIIAGQVVASELMMTLVSEGGTVGLAGTPHIIAGRDLGVVPRSLVECSPVLIIWHFSFPEHLLYVIEFIHLRQIIDV